MLRRYTLKALAAETGLSASTLHAWRRMGILQHSCIGPRGRKLYSEADFLQAEQRSLAGDNTPITRKIDYSFMV
jgi:DNA-binding transcriptional MerR regulator